MPLRRPSRSGEPAGPKPFSGEWLQTPPDAIGPSSRDRFHLPGWLPSERLLAGLLVVLLILVILPWRYSGLVHPPPGTEEPAVAAVLPTATIAVAPESPTEPVEQTIPTEATAPEPTQTVLPSPTPQPEVTVVGDEILPGYRVLSFYGFPGEPNMGILGEYDMETLLQKLKAQAAEYEAIDDRPYKLAFEVIASVAQHSPGADGDYLAYIGEETLQEYIDFTAANDLLLILDVQFGHKTVQEEVAAMEPYLKYSHVHLALDPEFSVNDDEVPGTVIGDIDAADVTYAQNALARISAENGLPPKLLIMHQFSFYSLTNRDQIQPVPGVQFVLEVDGFGTPEEKQDTYRVLAGAGLFEFHGFKLWYNGQDDPIMSPRDVLSIDPQPDLIIYQ